jgi:hypothetical protein
MTLEPYNEALCEEMRKLNLELVEHGNLYAVLIESPLHERISMAQLIDEEVQKIIQKLSEGSLFVSGGMTRELYGFVKD